MQKVIWRGPIRYHLLSFPVRLFLATDLNPDAELLEEERKADVPSFEQGLLAALQGIDGNRAIHVQVRSGQDSEAPYSTAGFLRGYELGMKIPTRSRVVLTHEELKTLRAPVSTEMEIQAYVDEHEIHPEFLGAAYNVFPDPGSEEAYELFRDALRREGLIAGSELALYGQEEWVVIFPLFDHLVLRTLSAHVEREERRPFKPKVSEEDLPLLEWLTAEMKSEAARCGPLTFRPADWQLRILEEQARTFSDADTPGDPHAPPPPEDLTDILQRSIELRNNEPERRKDWPPGKHARFGDG